MSDFNTLRTTKPELSLATVYEYWWAIAALLFAFWLFHPDLFMLRESPMFGDLWSNKDPTVSWSAYMPGLREFRYELFENGNIFWSPHRGLGQPIFGNGVQGAPLFPLTLVQLWLPDQLFWSINPMSRIFVAAVMMFLWARNIFKMPWLAALAFTLLATYNINVFRWINHPWTNGLLAGAWYLYFLIQVSLPSGFSNKRQALHAFALVLGVIGMVTNGFPEASAVFAMVVAFVYPAVIIARWPEFQARIGQLISRILLLHLIGFGLSIVQIVGLVEYVNYTQVLGLRDGISSNAFKPEEVAPYLNSQLTVLWRTDAQRDFISFTVGIIGGFLALQGLLSLIIDAKRHGRVATWAGIGFLLCMSLFVIKSFGLSELVEWVFSKTPVLDVSHFPLYFPPMFYFGSAYFAALALSAYRYEASEQRSYHLVKMAWAIISFGALIYGMKSVVNTFSAMGAREFWAMQFNAQGFSFVWLFLGISLGIIGFHFLHFLKLRKITALLPTRWVATVAGVLVVWGVALEQKHTVEANFVNSDTDAHRLFRGDSEWLAIDQAVAASGLPKHELRTRDESGDYIQTGLATIDNGASAMLPAELRLVRRALFDAPYGGYIPLRKAHYDWSSWLLSNNLTTIHSTPFSQPDWSSYKAASDLNPTHARREPEFKIKRENPVFFADWVDSVSLPTATTVWAKFDDGNSVRWLLTNNGGKRARNVAQKTITSSSWRIRLPIHELPSERYDITLRVVDETNKHYQDSVPIPLILEDSNVGEEAQGALKTPADSLLVQYDQGTRSIYFEHNALPRAFVASSCVQHLDENNTLELLKQGLPVLAGKVALNSFESDICQGYSNVFRRVPILTDSGSSLNFDTVTGPALLYLNDSYYPGWRAFDTNSGEELTVERANVAMRAVYLPDNKDYQITMKYRPWWLNWVILITLLALFALAWQLWQILNIKRQPSDD